MFYKCAKCGLASDRKDNFIPFHNPYSSYKTRYCMTCAEKILIQRGKSQLAASIIVLFTGFIWVLIAGRKHEFAWLMFQCGLFLCFNTLLVLPHEIGHALAAAILRAKIFEVSIGLGPTLYKPKFCGIDWNLHAIPICGYADFAICSKMLYRTRRFLTVLAGPMVNCLLISAALFLVF